MTQKSTPKFDSKLIQNRQRKMTQNSPQNFDLKNHAKGTGRVRLRRSADSGTDAGKLVQPTSPTYNETADLLAVLSAPAWEQALVLEVESQDHPDEAEDLSSFDPESGQTDQIRSEGMKGN
jgi:hypothetical protein